MGWLLVFVLMLCAPFTASAEEAFDLTVLQEAAGCAWTGPVDLDEPVFSAGCEATFTGTVTLNRVPGAAPSCPAVIVGAVSGSVSGSNITFGLVSGGFGNVNFTGMLTINEEGESASGTWAGGPGNGTWVAVDFVGFGGGTVSLDMTRPADGCEWAGPLAGAGAVTISGTAALSRVAGAAPCPMTFTGPLSGKLFGTAICFEVASAELGDITFVGTISRQAYTGSGTWVGNDAGEGVWTVMFPRSVGSATLSGLGLAVLVGLLLTAGVLAVRRQPD